MLQDRLSEALRDLLISHGVNGINQSVITHTLMYIGDAKKLQAKLEEWRQIGAVQKFRKEGKHRPATIWRATEKILDL